MKKIIVLHIFIALFLSAHAQITIAAKNVMREKAELQATTEANIAIIAKKTNDNKIIIVRSFHRNNTQSLLRWKSRFDSVSITKYDLNGFRLWQKRYAFDNSGYVSDISPTADGGYILCGDQNLSDFIMKIDDVGNISGIKEFANPNSNLYYNKIVELSNGNYAIASTEYIFKFAFLELTSSWWYPMYGYRHYYDIKYNVGVVDPSGNVQWSNLVTTSEENYYQYGLVVDRSFAADKFSPKLNVNIYPVRTDNMDFVDIAVNSYNPSTQLRTKSILRYNAVSGTVVGNKPYDVYNAYRYNSLGHWNVKDGYLFLMDSSAYGVNRSYFVKMDLYGNIKGYYQTSFLDWEWGRNLEFAQIHINSDSTIFLFEKSSYGNKLVRCFKDLSVDWNYSLPYVPERDYGNLLITETDDHNLLVVSNEYNYDTWEYVTFYKLSSDASELHYQVYIDRNDNDRYDAGDTTFNECIIYQTHNGITQQFYPDYYGKYEMFCDTGTYISYIESYSQTLKYYFAPRPDTTRVHSYTEEDTVFFKLVEKKNVRDLQVGVSPYIPVRPGFQSSYTFSVSNLGTVNVQHPRALFIKDPLQSFDELTAPAPFSGDTMYFDYDSLSILQYNYYYITLNNPVSPIISIGDTMHIKAIVEPIADDIYPEDNEFLVNQVVVGSYDPNDKLESHGGSITPEQLGSGEYLYYTIRFQNAGNYYASIIKITDTLSDMLDWSTLEVLSNSHNLEFKVEDQRYLTWWSNNFYLPDSTSDEPGSHGFVSYRIKPKAGLHVSDVIENTAHIYFDYNPEIATNTVKTEIVVTRPTAITRNILKTIKVYPNPTNDILQMDVSVLQNGKYIIQMLDFNGKEVYKENVDWTNGKQAYDISIGKFSVGMYFLRILNEKNKELYISKVLKK